MPSPFKADDTFFNRRSHVRMARHTFEFNHFFRGLVEQGFPEDLLVPFDIPEKASDYEIFTHLGGEKATRVTLAEIWRQMECQPNGEPGALFNDGRVNKFYALSGSSGLRSVNIKWFVPGLLSNAYAIEGWRADTYALGNFKWDAGLRVFSRKKS